MWFMSYTYGLRGIGGMGAGSCISKAEHPIEKIARWNRELEGRTLVLLFYRELTDTEVAALGNEDFDFEISP